MLSVLSFCLRTAAAAPLELLESWHRLTSTAFRLAVACLYYVVTPPPGTLPSVPPWLISELAGFLKRGEAQEEEGKDEEGAVRCSKQKLFAPVGNSLISQDKLRTCTAI